MWRDWPRRVQAVLNRLGALPSRKVTWGLALLFSLWVVVDVLVLHVSAGLSRSTYDAMVRARVWAAAPDPRIVVVDVDEGSLERMGHEFGRWPWPRDTLATVLDYVEQQQPAAIAWDIVFSDADRLSPGGDVAFDQAVRRSRHSHFPVVRLPAANDGASQLTALQFPGLWLPGPPNQVPVAMIAPALPAVAAAPLGFNNGYPDSDGVLRRYRMQERLRDGSQIQSMALAVRRRVVGEVPTAAPAADGLIAWRKQAVAYPRVSFADVFAQAEGQPVARAVPAFTGKIVVIGSSAPSLHDVHPTPLDPLQAGVESLATVIDNAVHGRVLRELPLGVQAAVAIVLCLGMALWAQLRSVSSLGPAMLVLPAGLLGVGYLSLNVGEVFLDLSLAAGQALVFVAVLRFWTTLRHNYWCTLPEQGVPAGYVLLPLVSARPWMDAPLERLMDDVQRLAPEARLLVPDAAANWPNLPRLPELVWHAAVVAPAEALASQWPALRDSPSLAGCRAGNVVPLSAARSRLELVHTAFMAWAALAGSAENAAKEKTACIPHVS